MVRVCKLKNPNPSQYTINRPDFKKIDLREHRAYSRERERVKDEKEEY